MRHVEVARRHLGELALLLQCDKVPRGRDEAAVGEVPPRVRVRGRVTVRVRVRARVRVRVGVRVRVRVRIRVRVRVSVRC